MRSSRWFIAPLVVVVLLAVAPAAAAVHLFPLFEGDPSDCAAGLQDEPSVRHARVIVRGFSFTDDETGTNVTEIAPGETVTWTWGLPHCHSVTSKTFTTYGGPAGAFNPDEPQLVKPEAGLDSYSVTFTGPGTYEYVCVHHASVGMRGTVVVR